MFGAAGTGDTSGYGGLVQPIVFPGAPQRPFEGWHDDVADALDEALAGGELEPAPLEGVVIHRGEITFHVRREDLLAVAQAAPRRPEAALRAVLGRQRRELPRGHRRASCTRSTTCSR